MIWIKYMLANLFIVAGFAGTFATPQIPDALIYNGDTLSVYLYLPDEFYRLDSITIDSLEYINRSLAVNLFGDKKACQTTACSNGYHATWEITDNQLYLTGIYSCCYWQDSTEADLISLFREKDMINGKVKACWVSSNNNVQGGAELLFFNNDMPVFKQDAEFEFCEGKLVIIKIYDNSKSRQSTYSQNMEKLLKFIYSHIDWEHLPVSKEEIKVVVRFSANENGTIDSVEIIRSTDSTENKIFEKEAVRVIKTIPEWDVIYHRGQHVRQPWIIPVVFSKENK